MRFACFTTAMLFMASTCLDNKRVKALNLDAGSQLQQTDRHSQLSQLDSASYEWPYSTYDNYAETNTWSEMADNPWYLDYMDEN